MKPGQLFLLMIRFHFWGAFGAVVFVSMVISGQLNNRTTFANTELYDDVIDRWGAPINQPSPSVRFVPSGSVFTKLQALPLEKQDIAIHADMNYRKRGLVYFSGFEFEFHGKYLVRNPEPGAVDIVFVAPINLEKNKSLLSDMTFLIDGRDAAAQLDDSGDKLVWTGRLEEGGELTFDLAYRGRGLDSFRYRMDPNLPVRHFNLAVTIKGGDNYDYAAGDMPAHQVEMNEDQIALTWSFPSLESGVPVGFILPSEKSFSNMIQQMIGRGWVTWLLFFSGMTALAVWRKRRFRIVETYLIAAGYGFTFVLLAYLAAFMNFYAAYALTLLTMGVLLVWFLCRLLGPGNIHFACGLFFSFMVMPTTAVLLEGYTGLIYTLEILGLLILLMRLAATPQFQAGLENLLQPPIPPMPSDSEAAHV